MADDQAYIDGRLVMDSKQDLVDEIAKLREALRDTPCPWPANTAPDDLTVGQCVDRLECGCNTGAALAPATTGRPT